MQFHNAARTLDFTSAGLVVDAPVRIDEPIFADDFDYLRRGRPGGHDAEADDPVAEHGALPRRHGRDRSGRLPRRGAVLGRPLRGLRRAGAGSPSSAAATCSSTTPAWPTSTTRPSAPAGRAGRRRRAPAPALHPPDQRRDRRTGPTGLAVTTHMCRGNFRSSWAAEGGYDFVAEALFSELDVDGFFLEYDDERSGGFEPLRFVPAGQAGRARAWSPPSAARWRARTTSSDASTRPRSSCRSSSSACRRSAGSPPPSRATTLTQRRARWPSCADRRGRPGGLGLRSGAGVRGRGPVPGPRLRGRS